MRKKRSTRMQRLVGLARIEERRECQEMGRLQRSLDDDKRRLNELESYRKEYSRRFEGAGQVAPARWQDYQNFLQRIDHAMTDQKQQIQIGRQARDAHRARWLVKRQKLESIERVVERFQKGEDAIAERQLEKSLDDLYSTARFNRSRSDR